MSESLRHYLLVYDLELRALEVTDMGEDAEAAALAYSEAEEKYGGIARYEVVLIGADSVETIQTTHAHYFQGAGNGDSLRARLLAAAG